MKTIQNTHYFKKKTNVKIKYQIFIKTCILLIKTYHLHINKVLCNKYDLDQVFPLNDTVILY